MRAHPCHLLFGLVLFLSQITDGSSQFPPASACSLQKKCCNMGQNNCCTAGEGSCYTTWERVCDSDTQDQECSTVAKRFCIPIPIKSCRTVTERIYRNFRISHCSERPLQKCFDYKRRVCVSKETVTQKEISWVNEKLVLNNATTIRKCFNVQSMSCSPRSESQVIRVPVQKTKQVSRVRQECSMQTVRGKDQVIRVPVAEVVNRRLCWNIPEIKCLKKRVSCGAVCPLGAPCGSPELQGPSQVCPLNPTGSQPAYGSGGGNCISLNPPSCGSSSCVSFGGSGIINGGEGDGSFGGSGMINGGGSFGGSGMINGGGSVGGSGMINGGGSFGGSGMINGGGTFGGSGMINGEGSFGGSGMINGGGSVGGSGMINGGSFGGSMGSSGGMGAVGGAMASSSMGQLCCRRVMKNICRQVPYRVTKMVEKAIPGKVGYQRVCKDVVEQVPQTYWDDEIKYVNKTRNNCKPTMKPECINLTVRTFDVKSQNMSDTVDVHLPVCESKEIDAQHCTTFPTGNIICRNTTVPKSFNLHKIKCDVEQTRSQCANIPILDCKGTFVPGSCRMVPKTICPKKGSCNNGPLCSSCDNFRRRSGFGSCPGNSCPNFASSDNWANAANAESFFSTLNSLPAETLGNSISSPGQPQQPQQPDMVFGPNGLNMNTNNNNNLNINNNNNLPGSFYDVGPYNSNNGQSGGGLSAEGGGGLPNPFDNGSI